MFFFPWAGARSPRPPIWSRPGSTAPPAFLLVSEGEVAERPQGRLTYVAVAILVALTLLATYFTAFQVGLATPRGPPPTCARPMPHSDPGLARGGGSTPHIDRKRPPAHVNLSSHNS